MINENDVLKLASLSKLKVSDEQIKPLTEQLGQILGFVEKLKDLDLKDIEATSHAVSVNNVFRKDEAIVSKDRDDALAQAPELEENQIKVPRII